MNSGYLSIQATAVPLIGRELFLVGESYIDRRQRMIKALKVTMIVWSAIVIFMGLVYIIFPDQLNEMGGYPKGSSLVIYLLALLGICYISAGAFVILATRDLLKNIRWVQFAIAVTILTVVVVASSIGRGLVTFSQEGIPLIINTVFAVVFLALYPYRKVKGD
jgi:hypothetical protein